MHKLIVLLVAAALPMLTHAAAPAAGEPCKRAQREKHAVGKNGELLVCVVNDASWKIVEPRSGEPCLTLKPNQAVKHAGGRILVCRDGKWLESPAAD